MTLKFRNDPVRIIYTDAPGAVMPEHKDEVFAVIGPIGNFSDRTDLQDALEWLIRGYNLEPANRPRRKKPVVPGPI